MGFLLIGQYMLPRLLAAALLTVALPAVHAATACGDKCIGFIEQAHAHEVKGEYEQALDAFEAAHKAAPTASQPLAFMAAMLQRVSKLAPSPDPGNSRGRANAAARQALQRDPEDPIALEALRLLDDDGPSPLSEPNPAAARVLHEAERLFAERSLPAALKKYQEAMLLDPGASYAWLGAGDCHYLQGEWAEAAALFRRAAEIEPRNAQAWRYLSDALLAQGKANAAEDAIIAAIAADPGQRTSWAKLALMRRGAGIPLRPLRLQRAVKVTLGADGKTQAAVDEKLLAPDAGGDFGFLLMLGLAEIEAGKRTGADRAPPFEQALGAWETAIRVFDESGAAAARPQANSAGDSADISLRDPALRQIQAMARDGQLKPAILILMFRQSYRPALEEWIAANPGGVRAFIDRYGVQP